MSEIKPVAWLVEDCEDSCFATVNAQMFADFMADTDSVSTPLYTAKQLAEAVAAERERILRAHNISVEDDLFWYFDDREYGHNEASELLRANEFEIVHIATGRNTGELFGFSTKDEDYFFKTEAEAVAAIEAIRSAAK